MMRADNWETYEEAELPQVVDQRNKKVPWTQIERWWEKNVGTPRGKQAIRSKMERWQLKEKVRELTARQSVQHAEDGPPLPRRVEGGLGKDRVLGVRSPSLVGKPYRKAKRLKRRSEWSVPSSPEPMSVVKTPSKSLLRESDRRVEQAGGTQMPGIKIPEPTVSIPTGKDDSSLREPVKQSISLAKPPSKSLRRESNQGRRQASAIGIPAPATPSTSGGKVSNLREPVGRASEKPKKESRNDDYGLIKLCAAYLTRQSDSSSFCNTR
jgi:hypothetical protein